jgi:hypothetical protein
MLRTYYNTDTCKQLSSALWYVPLNSRSYDFTLHGIHSTRLPLLRTPSSVKTYTYCCTEINSNTSTIRDILYSITHRYMLLHKRKVHGLPLWAYLLHVIAYHVIQQERCNVLPHMVLT